MQFTSYTPIKTVIPLIMDANNIMPSEVKFDVSKVEYDRETILFVPT